MRTPEGTVRAVANLLVGVRPDEVAIDLMRGRNALEPRTMMRLAWLMLQKPLTAGYRQIDAVSHTISLQDLADCIAEHWGLPTPQSNIHSTLPVDRYAGEPTAFAELLSQYRLSSPTLLEQILDTASSLAIGSRHPSSLSHPLMA